jgi:tetratricopeptide (TPR) repeat protein
VRWFRRLADVPGLSYGGSQTVDRTRLSEHDLEPEVWEYKSEGESRLVLEWPTSGGDSTSESPVHQRISALDEDLTPQEALRWLEETLELPGELSDYYYAIKIACWAIYEGRREDPSLLKEVERLYQLDMELVESYPKSVEYESHHMLAYERLAALYTGEGYFHEALEVAKRGLRMNQEDLSLSLAAERLHLVLEELEAEDVGR